MYKRVFNKCLALLLVVVLLSQSISVFASSRHDDELGRLFAEIGICPIAASAWISSSDIDWSSGPENWVSDVLAMQEITAEILGDFLETSHSNIAEFDGFNFSTPYSSDMEFDESQFIYGIQIDTFNDLPHSEQLEIVNLELLASSIFDFYETYGYFPTQEEYEAYHSLDVSSDVGLSDVSSDVGLSYVPVSALSSTADLNQAVSIFQQMGIWVSSFAVSLAAAKIGALAAIGAAIPIMQVVALVAGTTLVAGGLTMGLVMAYANIYSISMELHIMMGYTNVWNRSVAENAIRQIQMVQQAKRSGFVHFAANRNWGPGGGIYILFPIQRDVAIQGLGRGADTFSVSMQHAYDVAVSVTGSTRLDWGHNLYNQPLNLPHYHPYWPGVTFGHAFFSPVPLSF